MDRATRERLKKQMQDGLAAKRAFVADAKVLDAVTAVADPPQEPTPAKKPKQRNGPGRLPHGAKFAMTHP